MRPGEGANRRVCSPPPEADIRDTCLSFRPRVGLPVDVILLQGVGDGLASTRHSGCRKIDF